ncbi:MAG: glycosyltransferase [Deltaproteobacteria bacterium]|nr:glycosyltransferase [Deltaproteobacteria bacterium]
MRVIQIVASVANEASGPTYSVTRLCESLIDRGHRVTLAVLDWEAITDLPEYLRIFPLGLGPRRLGRSPKMFNWLKEQIKSGLVDIIHNNGLWMMPNIYPGLLIKNSNIPYVVSPRGTLSDWAMKSGSKLKKIVWHIVQKPSLKNVRCFHATSLSEYEDIRSRGFKQPVAVIPNGIDIPLELSVSKTRDLLFLSRIHPKKGLDLLLHAWKAVESIFPEWKLKICGPDNNGYSERMKRLASELGLLRVEFCGPVYGEEKFKVYARAGIFVLPTYSENFGIAVAEALASGTPAIVTKGAPWSGLTERNCGWWIDIGVEPLIECLKVALAKDLEELRLMGQNGRQWMIEEFSWEKIGKMMEETYKWILKGGLRPEWVIVD